jgi:hypothetical protein
LRREVEYRCLTWDEEGWLSDAAANAQMSKVKTVRVVLMENHNWTGITVLHLVILIAWQPVSTICQRRAARYCGSRAAVSQPTRQPSHPAQLVVGNFEILREKIQRDRGSLH